jgi:hypothetical protein
MEVIFDPTVDVYREGHLGRNTLIAFRTTRFLGVVSM